MLYSMLTIDPVNKTARILNGLTHAEVDAHLDYHSDTFTTMPEEDHVRYFCVGSTEVAVTDTVHQCVLKRLRDQAPFDSD